MIKPKYKRGLVARVERMNIRMDIGFSSWLDDRVKSSPVKHKN
jgi:hypothetical protein